ncbi:MAG: nitroreductase/quinone reductase family protein [Microbacterium sp.]
MSAIEPGIYRHFTGQRYEVWGTAKHSETEEEHVVYRALYGEGGLWVRPRAAWDEWVERDGYAGPRFVKVLSAPVAAALALGPESTTRDHTVDITTIGARSNEPRRIEIWFHNVEGTVFLTGLPGPRAWYANLLAHPGFTFHLTNEVKADLPATAAPVTDPEERTRVLGAIIAGIDDLYARSGSAQRVAHPERWVAQSPLVRVDFA